MSETSKRIPEPSANRGLTLRSLFWGVVMVAAINLGSPYAEWVLHSQLLTTNYFPIGLMFLFFVLVALINVSLKSLRLSWARSPAELAVASGSMAVGISGGTYGVLG